MSRPRKRDTKLPPYVRIRHGSYVYKDEKLCRADEGEAAMYDALAKRMKLTNVELVPAAVAAYKLDYLGTLSDSARKEHERLLDLFADEFSEFAVAQITSRDVKRSVRNLFAGKLSAAKAYKSRISTFFRWCIDEHNLRDINPCNEVWLKQPPKTKTPWTDSLFYAVRDRLSAMHQCYHDLSFLLYQRTTDVRLLRRADVFDSHIHFQPTKTEKSSGAAVDIKLTPEIRAVLERAATISKEWKVVCGYVIHTRDGTPFTRSGIYSAYMRADAALHGKPIGLNPKALRPYAATAAKLQGFSSEDIQTGLAHVSIRTTEGYIQQHEVPVSPVVLRLPERR